MVLLFLAMVLHLVLVLLLEWVLLLVLFPLPYNHQGSRQSSAPLVAKGRHHLVIFSSVESFRDCVCDASWLAAASATSSSQAKRRVVVCAVALSVRKSCGADGSSSETRALLWF